MHSFMGDSRDSSALHGLLFESMEFFQVLLLVLEGRATLTCDHSHELELVLGLWFGIQELDDVEVGLGEISIHLKLCLTGLTLTSVEPSLGLAICRLGTVSSFV